MEKCRHLIIGCGSAAMSAAEEIRRVSPEDEVIMVTMEHCDPYSPLSLPYVLAGRITESNIGLSFNEKEDLLREIDNWIKISKKHYDKL